MKSHRLLFASLLLAFIGSASAQPPAAPDPMPKYARGHNPPTEAYRKEVHAEAFKRLGNKVAALQTATPTTFDCRTAWGMVPVDDQGNCGSCWDVATCDCITNAYVRAGLLPRDGSKRLSPQYILDTCGPPNGGCSGDWGITVIKHAKSTGIPLASDYGPYTARAGQCKFKAGTPLLKIDDYGFCTPAQEEGMSTTQDIKNAIVAYGEVNTAIAANGDWDNYRGGVMPYRRLTANNVNHEVGIAGWDDTKTAPGTSAKGAFLVRNQWSKEWGEGGYCWVPYGSHQIGTEAIWVKLAVEPPPPPPVGKGFTGTVTTTWKDGSMIGPPVSTSSTTPAIEPGKPYTIDLSKYGPIVRWRLKHKLLAVIDDDSVIVTDNGDSITIAPKPPRGADGKVGEPNWDAFLEFLTKLIPLILQIMAMFGV